MSWAKVEEIVGRMATKYGMDRRRHPMLRELLELVEAGITMEGSGDGSRTTPEPEAESNISRGSGGP